MIIRIAPIGRIAAMALVVSAWAWPARAQTRMYVGGDIFADIPRLSRTTVSPALDFPTADITTPPDGTALGGGVRVGALFTPVWSLELGVDVGRPIREERTLSIRSPLAVLLPTVNLQYTSRTSQQHIATTVLVGYHPVVRGRIQPGFRGGVSFTRTERSFTVANTTTVTFSPTVPGGVVIPSVTLTTNDYTTVKLGLSGVVAAETAVEVSEHFALVPEVRALAGGLGGILVRPGVAAHWRW